MQEVVLEDWELLNGISRGEVGVTWGTLGLSVFHYVVSFVLMFFFCWVFLERNAIRRSEAKIREGCVYYDEHHSICYT